MLAIVDLGMAPAADREWSEKPVSHGISEAQKTLKAMVYVNLHCEASSLCELPFLRGE